MSCDDREVNTPPCYLSDDDQVNINKHTHDDLSDSDEEQSPAKVQKGDHIPDPCKTLAHVQAVSDCMLPVMPVPTLPTSFNPSQPQNQFISATPHYGGDANLTLPVQYVQSSAHTFSPLNDGDQDRPVYTESEEREAEDIVRKLCKNGKLMEFQEGEDFIKVIVYEDSQEDLEETQSADEHDDQPLDYCCKKPAATRNLLDCLTEKAEIDQRTSTPVQPVLGAGGPAVFPGSSLPNLPPSFSGQHTAGELYSSGHLQPGFMYYSKPGCLPMSTPVQTLHTRTPNNTPVSNVMKTPAGDCGRGVLLNSSGEEVSPSDPLVTPNSQQLHSRVRSLMHLPPFHEEDTGKVREQHNQKERRRRARIKEACNLLRQLVPGMSDKTDKATVFEFAARYVHFLKSHTGAQYDKDFLMKYSPY